MRMEKPPRKYICSGMGYCENISVTACAALYGVFFVGGVLEYGQKKNRPKQGGLSCVRILFPMLTLCRLYRRFRQ